MTPPANRCQNPPPASPAPLAAPAPCRIENRSSLGPSTASAAGNVVTAAAAATATTAAPAKAKLRRK